MPVPLAQEQLEKVVEEYLESQGYELVDLRVTGSISRPVIGIYCDIEGGITAEECGKLAKALKYRLAADGLLDERGSLMVSSPGFDRVLKRERDFARFKGREVNVWLMEHIDGRGKLRGRLVGYQDGTVMIEGTEEGDIALAPGRWKEIRLVPEYPKAFK